MSENLALRIESSPTRGDRIFDYKSLGILSRSFRRQKKRLAFKLNDQKLLQVTFRSLRHFKGTTEFLKTRDILHVQRVLGHRSITNTMVYVHIADEVFHDEDDAYVSKAASTKEEAMKLIVLGFEHICSMGDGTMLFRQKKTLYAGFENCEKRP